MLIHMFMHVSNVTSQHTSLHTERKKKRRYCGLFSVLHCSSPLPTGILQSCSVILQNVPLMSAQVLDKYMYFVRNYCSVCVRVCVPITEDYNPPVSSLLHYRNCFHIFVFTCAWNHPEYRLYNEILQKFLRLVNHTTFPVTTNEAIRTSFTTI